MKVEPFEERPTGTDSNRSAGSTREIANRERHLGLCREFVQGHLTDGSTLVEVGGADAPFDHLPDLDLGRWVSLDVDFHALRKAEARGAGAGGSLVAADGHHLPIRAETIDGIIAVFVMEHLRHPQRFLEEAWRALKPGGFVFVVTPNLANPLFFPILLVPLRLREKLLRVLGGHPDHGYLTYLRANTARRMELLAGRTGFKLARLSLLWEDHYFTKLPAGEAILSAIDQWGSGTQLQSFAGRLYALLEKRAR